MIDELRERFRDRFVAMAQERIQKSLIMLGDHANAEALALELHSLAGEASMLGLHDIAGLARESETTARKWWQGDATAQVRCARSIRVLKRHVEAFAGESPTEAQKASPDPSPPSNSKIVVIDDSELVSAQLAEAMEAQGYTVITAHDHASTEHAVATLQPDLVVTDVHMPGVDLKKLCTEIRAANSAPLIIVLLSGQSAEQLKELAREVGADGWVSKRGGIDAIVAEIGKTLAASAQGDIHE